MDGLKPKEQQRVKVVILTEPSGSRQQNVQPAVTSPRKRLCCLCGLAAGPSCSPSENSFQQDVVSRDFADDDLELIVRRLRSKRLIETTWEAVFDTDFSWKREKEWLDVRQDQFLFDFVLERIIIRDAPSHLAAVLQATQSLFGANATLLPSIYYISHLLVQCLYLVALSGIRGNESDRRSSMILLDRLRSRDFQDRLKPSVNAALEQVIVQSDSLTEEELQNLRDYPQDFAMWQLIFTPPSPKRQNNSAGGVIPLVDNAVQTDHASNQSDFDNAVQTDNVATNQISDFDFAGLKELIEIQRRGLVENLRRAKWQVSEMSEREARLAETVLHLAGQMDRLVKENRELRHRSLSPQSF